MTEPRKEFLDLALSCGAKLTGKPDGSEAVTVVFTVDAWRAFDAACLSQTLATAERKGEPFPGYVQLAETLRRIQRNVSLSRDDQIALSHAADTLAALPMLTERKGEPIGYVPRWAVDRLTGKMGAAADPITWGLYAPIMSRPCPNYVGIYTSPQVPEDVQRDAERYRWLRATENANRDEWNLFGPYSTPEQIDAAIDAARKDQS